MELRRDPDERVGLRRGQERPDGGRTPPLADSDGKRRGEDSPPPPRRTRPPQRRLALRPRPGIEHTERPAAVLNPDCHTPDDHPPSRRSRVSVKAWVGHDVAGDPGLGVHESVAGGRPVSGRRPHASVRSAGGQPSPGTEDERLSVRGRARARRPARPRGTDATTRAAWVRSVEPCASNPRSPASLRLGVGEFPVRPLQRGELLGPLLDARCVCSEARAGPVESFPPEGLVSGGRGSLCYQTTRVFFASGGRDQVGVLPCKKAQRAAPPAGGAGAQGRQRPPRARQRCSSHGAE